MKSYHLHTYVEAEGLLDALSKITSEVGDDKMKIISDGDQYEEWAEVKDTPEGLTHLVIEMNASDSYWSYKLLKERGIPVDWTYSDDWSRRAEQSYPEGECDWFSVYGIRRQGM